jgi:uncharacterized protein (TIGR03083 family)
VNDSSPIDVLHLFRPERNALLELLRDIEPEQWSMATACDGWTVKDVALHLLGGDIGIVSRKRDNFQIQLPPAESFVDALNLHNATWIDAMRRLSPELLIDLLDHVGQQAIATFASLDLFAIGWPVTWAGPEPAPVWLDVAREYTERWHHQQHIRDAVDQPGLIDKEFAGPVFETFVQALPWSFRSIEAVPGTTLELRVVGDAGGRWGLVRDDSIWRLLSPGAEIPCAVVELPAEVAWKMFTNGLPVDECASQATITGDPNLARALFETRAIIV